MKLVFLNGVFMIEGRDYRWERDRLIFNFLIEDRSDVISVVDLVRYKTVHYGTPGSEPVVRVLDPTQKTMDIYKKRMDGGDDERRRLGRGSGLPELRVPSGDGQGDPGDPREG